MRKRIFGFVLAVIMTVGTVTMVSADEEDDIRAAREQAQSQLDDTNSTLDSLAEKQEEIQSEISTLNADLVDKMVQINQAESDIEATRNLVASTQTSIDETLEKLVAERANRDQQYADMVKRIQYIYENGGMGGWTTILLKAADFSGILNRIEYTKALEKADREALTAYENTIAQISSDEQSLESQKSELEAQQTNLELQEEMLQDEKAELEQQLDKAQSANANYENQIAEARSQAARIEELMSQQQAELERIEAEKAEAARKAAEEAARKAAEEEAARKAAESRKAALESSSGTGSQASSGGSSNSSQTVTSNTGAGQQIVNYALQYVGYPYVWGGSSLTNGVDCSHFVWLVLRNCGYYSGGYMTSGYWAYAGSPVASLAEAQAGDIIVYSGHVAIYDGNGMIVEAKGSAYGITHDRRADCKGIVAIRRFV